MVDSSTSTESAMIGATNLHELEAGTELAAFEPQFSEHANYPDISEILMRLNEPTPPANVPTDSLRVNGDCRQDKMEKYLGAHEYLSSSNLKQAQKTPLNFYYSINHSWKSELEKCRNQKAFELGTFIHECILEPTKFSRVIVEPKLSRSTKDGVNSLIEFWERTISKQLPETYQDIFDMAHAIRLNDFDKLPGKKEYLQKIIQGSGIHPVRESDYAQIKVTERNYHVYGGGILPRLMKWAKREISFYATDQETGQKVRVRPDAIQFKENIGVDAIISVKSTRHENLKGFYYQSANLNYELSEGMYQEVVSAVTGRKFLTTLCIMVQTVAPFAVALLRWNPEDLEIGKHKYRMALMTAKECIESNNYPGFDAFAEAGNYGIIQMKQPGWNAKPLPDMQLEN